MPAQRSIDDVESGRARIQIDHESGKLLSPKFPTTWGEHSKYENRHAIQRAMKSIQELKAAKIEIDIHNHKSGSLYHSN